MTQGFDQPPSGPDGSPARELEAARRVGGTTKPVDVDRLERCVRFALERDLPRREIVAVLRPLVEHTRPESDRGRLARVQLAEQLLALEEEAPQRVTANAWQAATLLHAISRLQESRSTRPLEQDSKESSADPLPSLEHARVQAAFGLACTVLGHYRAAKRAYLRALKVDPHDAVAAHNLGHLLATKLGAPAASLIWLQRAHQGLPDNHEVAASLAHALVKTGQLERAVAILARVLGSSSKAHGIVARWLEQSQAETDLAAGCE